MANKRKVCVVTGTRAEYGLLYWVLKALANNECFELQIIATGMHLSPEFGLTYKEIERDGFVINKKIEILLSSDSEIGISKSIGLGIIGFAEAYAELKPDIILLLGDRFEILAAATAAMIARIPIAHCHGGEATEGLIDEAIRHSVTKMSHIHFTSTEEYRKRVIQLGEHPEYVFNVGALGIENINKLELLDKEKFEESINFSLGSYNILVTYHPVTLERQSSELQFHELLNALEHFKDARIIFTKSNSDTEGRIINTLIDGYTQKNSHKSIAYSSLGQLRYLSALKHVDVVIGNSSSGLIEMPSFNKPTINIGDRQNGRIKARSVIDCKPENQSIVDAMETARSTAFLNTIADMKNPYQNFSEPSKAIINTLKGINVNDLIKKKFYNFSS